MECTPIQPDFSSDSIDGFNSRELHGFCYYGAATNVVSAAKVSINMVSANKVFGNTNCKPKPCKAYRELPVRQFSQVKTCFHYKEPCSHCRDPVFIPCKTLYFPVRDCSANVILEKWFLLKRIDQPRCGPNSQKRCPRFIEWREGWALKKFEKVACLFLVAFLLAVITRNLFKSLY